MKGSSEACTCGHAKGGHFFWKRQKLWGPCKRCPFGKCRRFLLASEYHQPVPPPRTDILARVYPDPGRATVALLLDESTANVLVYAARALAAESEAHAREVRAVAAALPVGSYGRKNRERIAVRQERVAARCRAVEVNYRTAHEGVAS